MSVRTRIRSVLRKYLWPIYERSSYKQARNRIKNNRFTLLASNCIGGVIYHHLGMSFDSPMINISMKQPEFCMFCSDLDYYLSSELHFFESDFPFPCAHLGIDEKEITIEFRHYKNADEAKSKWEERKKRIHRDNLFIILNDGNGLTSDDIKLLEKCNYRRKVIFTSKHRPEIEDSFYLHAMRKYNDALFMQAERHPVTGKWPWEKEFDFVAWLNGEDKYRFD